MSDNHYDIICFLTKEFHFTQHSIRKIPNHRKEIILNIESSSTFFIWLFITDYLF